MSEHENPGAVSDDMVVKLAYTLTVDGEVVDSTEGEDPIEFLQGHGQIIPGLERELSGLGVGENKAITLTPEDAYGDYDPRHVVDVPLDEFPDDFPIELGVELQVKDQEGNVRQAVIAEVGKEKAKLDFNHPLAGKDLHFKVEVVAVRPASEEELAHGHAHGDGHAH